MTSCQQALPVRLIHAALLGLLLADVATLAQEPAPVKWKTGTAFRNQLDQPEALSWQEKPLREGLVRISQTYGVACFLDRRIDPGHPVTLAARNQPVEELIKQAAASAKAELTTLGPVVYVGPQQAASQLATLAAIRKQDVAKLSGDAKARLLRPQPWQSSELTQPRQILSELAKQASVTIQNADLIPLDLWPAISLPPLPWTDRMTLLLVGFGLTFEIDSRGTALRLVPTPATALLEKRYSPRGGPNELAAQLRRILPEASMKVEQSQLIVAARQEDHEKVEQLLSGEPVRTTKPAKVVTLKKEYSMKVDHQSAGNVVTSVANQIGKELKYEPAVLDKLKQQVTFDVKGVTLDNLLEQTLKPVGLTYRITESTLEVIEPK